jgi:hypothetical protein
MLPQTQKNIFIYKFLNGLSPVRFSNYSVYYTSFSTRDKRGHFGMMDGNILREKLEGKIVIKSWKELPSKFPNCILGDYCLTPDTFSGIIMIDETGSPGGAEKQFPRILTSFKNRSTLLLNQFHGTHGRIFWENSYDSIKIDSFESYGKTLELLRKTG